MVAAGVVASAALVGAGSMIFGARHPSPAMAATAPTATATAAATVTPEQKPHGGNRMNRKEATVRLDGREIAVLSYGELPPGVSMVTVPGRTIARYFRVADYLRGLGVPLASIAAVHFLGNRDRVASIEGSELRAHPSRFVFDFTRTTEGNPSVRWDTTGLRNTKRIDNILGIEIFVATKPRAIELSLGCYAAGDDACAEGIVQEAPHGTRVYVDGRLVTTVKRRNVGDPGPGSSLERVLSTAGVKVEAVRGVELVAHDGVVARSTGAGVRDWLGSVTLAAPRGGHGRTTATLPADDASRSTPLDVVLLYRDVPAPARTARPLDDAIAEAPGRGGASDHEEL